MKKSGRDGLNMRIEQQMVGTHYVEGKMGIFFADITDEIYQQAKTAFGKEVGEALFRRDRAAWLGEIVNQLGIQSFWVGDAG